MTLAQAKPRPELLAPAGNWACAKAAVANGADAIYFGLSRFNARLRAENFTDEDLPALMEFLHLHGVKGYVAFNTLVFTKELEEAAAQLRRLEEAGVDAVIVQDIGLARLCKILAPNVALHASTQMTITSPEGLEFLRELDLDQAVLARETSLRELERFDTRSEQAVPLEVFVHGALCVAYSGQCLTSESLGQRSANRGECAQACRMPYQMIVDGALVPLGDKRYLLSPQDLAATKEIPRLVALGIRSFKIEGRLKTPEYVAAVTAVYRQAVDAALANRTLDEETEAKNRYALEMTFSRGLYSGWFHGVNHQELVGARFAKKRGPLAGKIRFVGADHVELEQFETPLKPGDGLVFDTGGDTDREQGGRIYEIAGRKLRFQHGKIRFAALKPGHLVWKTEDAALEQQLRKTFAGDLAPRAWRPLRLKVEGRGGEPLVLSAVDENQRVLARSQSELPLQTAASQPLQDELLTRQLGRLGGTGWKLERLDNALPAGLMLPVSQLNYVRRDLLEKLARKDPAPRPLPPLSSWEALLASAKSARQENPPPEAAVLSVLCRDLTQLRTVLGLGVTKVYLDLEDIRQYAGAVQTARAEYPQAEIFLATPRIQKAGETGHFKLMERAEPHGILARNWGALHWFKGGNLPLTGDFSLNVSNPLTAQWLMERGLEQATISPDLNVEQILDLLAAAPGPWFELILHQHMPMFHMEHCAFAAFLSEGTDFTNCGRPCEKHRVRLRDRVGMEHPLKADVGCRNTLFNATPQSGLNFYESLGQAGLRHYRVELLEENSLETKKLISLYQAFLRKEITAREVFSRLKVQSRIGVTGGTYTVKIAN